METLKVRGIKIESSCIADAIDDLAEAVAAKKGGYVSFVESKLLSKAAGNSTLTFVLNKSLHTYPSGTSTALCASLRVRHRVRRIRESAYVLQAVERGLQPRWRHFFCGGGPGAAEKMAEEFRKRFPEIEIVGTFSPSSSVISDADDKELQKAVGESSPDIIWVGLDEERQDLFMYNRRKDFQGIVMAGVGNAFDYLSGSRADVPEWLSKIGMEWAWRSVSGGWRTFIGNMRCVAIAGWYLFMDLVRFPFRKQSAEIPEAAEIGEDERNAIAAIGNWISGDGTAACTDETYDFLERHSLGQLAYFYAKDSMSEDVRKKAEAANEELSRQDARQQEAADQVSQLLLDRNIRYCLIKGTDLAKSAYPSGTLRKRHGVDILVHPDNIRKAIAILRANGWELTHDIGIGNFYPTLAKDGISLRLHDQLPITGKRKVETTWKLLRNESGSRFEMPLEIALVMIFNQARKRVWQDGFELLIDLAHMAVKLGKIDWNEIRKAAAVCNAMSPEIAFLIFPELFPEKTVPSDSEVSTKARELFADIVLHAPKLSPQQMEKAVHPHNRFSRGWRERLLAEFSPWHIRLVTENPSGNRLKLAKGYFRIGWARISTFFKRIATASTPEIDAFLRKSSALDKGI